VTTLLRAWSAGDQDAKEKLWEIVFPELNRLANGYMRDERPTHTLQAGALVNEAYLRLVDWKSAEWRNRAHFLGMCARIMRQILVDHARAHGYQKRGGSQHIEPLDEAALASPRRSDDLVALDDAMQRLASISKRKSDVVEFRFFGGLSVEETAAALVAADRHPGLELRACLAARRDEWQKSRIVVPHRASHLQEGGMAACAPWSIGGIARIGCLAIVIATASPATGQVVNGPKQYYLALGDSIAYGYQASKHEAGLPPSAFDTGYVDVFAARLRAIQPGLTVVNYGCPGETMRSFLKGPCLWTEFGEQLHDSFTGRQLDAALSFLRAHPGEVSPITVTLWGNNVREFVSGCEGDDVCVQRGAVKFIDDLSKDLAKILRELRKEAPDADIIVTGSWDSFIDALEFADPLFQLLNASMAATATAERARFADPFPLFNPQGDLAREIESLCALLLLCTENDSHPSDLGYQVLGNLVFDVSGYGLLVP
jgi:RNA polymerase sigma factor (TIGR02999 family)